MLDHSGRLVSSLGESSNAHHEWLRKQVGEKFSLKEYVGYIHENNKSVVIWKKSVDPKKYYQSEFPNAAYYNNGKKWVWK